MVNIIKEEISLEESLKKKIEFICEFAKVQLMVVLEKLTKRTYLILSHIGLLLIILLFLLLTILMKYL